jgi:DNA primase
VSAIDTRPILRDADLLGIVQAAVKLHRRGREWWGLCPFHDDSTPSFHVRPERGHWHCFGCGATGDAISFVRRTRSLSFRAACEWLSPGCTTATQVRYADPMDDPVLRDLAFAVTDRAYREYRDTWPMSALPRERG